jgi:type I restriction enzyme R subunit
MDEDPAFYRKFGDMLEAVIAEFRAERLAEAAYFERVQDIESSVLNRSDADIPASVAGHDMARRYYGVILETLKQHEGDGFDPAAASARAALDAECIIREHHIRDWTTNEDQKNRMRNAIEDSLYELKDSQGIDLSFEEMDAIMDLCLDIAGRVQP